MKYIDIHSHLQFSQFDSDIEEVLARMEKEEVGSIVVGTDAKTSTDAISLAEQNENIFATVGLHPNENTKEIFNIGQYRACAKHDKVVAIGECGLDYFRTPDIKEVKDRQKKIFEDHITLAVEEHLPLMIHCRDAHEDLLAILSQKKKEHAENLFGNIHFFSGDYETAKKYFDLGFTISFTGVITFTHAYDEVIKNSPVEYILAETDAPYAAPVPWRGGRSEPVHVKDVVRRIALIRGIEEEEMRSIIFSNTRRIFFSNM